MADLPNPLRVIRAADLLVVDVELSNLTPSADGLRLERSDPGAPAHIVLRFPAQHVAERAFSEPDIPGVRPREPSLVPPSAALAAGPSRLVFALREGQSELPLSIEALLDWDALEPKLAAGALPAGATEGPPPALPAADETAIEFPYRLMLSPDSGGHWIHRRAPFTATGRTELWHTRLHGTRSTANVRALARRAPRDVITTSTSDRDLDEIVTLTADFSVRPESAAQLGIPRSVWEILLSANGLRGFHMKPLPLDVEQLMLTALGASVRMRGAWDYPAVKQDPAELFRFGMPAPSLQQYEHIAGQGRDQFVRVVRRGYLSTGHRASIVKVTERRFEPVQIRTDQTPLGAVGIFGANAYLRQYFQIVVQEPVLHYRDLASGYLHGGREMPLRSLRLTTLITPHLEFDPPLAQVEADARATALVLRGRTEEERRREREEFVQTRIENVFSATPFWIRAGGSDFQFGVVGTGWEDELVSFPTPLMFIPYKVASEAPPAKVLAVFKEGAASRRTRPLSNQKLAIADPAGSEPASTRCPVGSLTFALQGLAGPVPATYRPRWLAYVASADAEIESVARITGRSGAVPIAFADEYLQHGLAPGANAAGVFAKLTGPKFDVKFAGEGAGGLARPDAPVNRLSCRQGAMSSAFVPTPNQPITTAQLKALFAGAKLFGSVPLEMVLKELSGVGPGDFAFADLPEEALQELLDGPTRDPRIPLLRTRTLVRDGTPYAIEARYVWKPELQSFAMLDFDERSKLVLDARTVTPLDGGPAQSELRGELRNFALEFAKVVRIQMDVLKFTALPGRKPDITAEGFDLQFIGPLEFINTLREILPSDGFSDPPAVSVTPAGISAGYTLGIPTVGVGIFSLQNVSLSAALTIPFNDQPAGFRFAVSERHAPFLVTVTLFGGGGFFALGVGASGVESIEAAIEFGGSIALNLGVASGGVSVMAGVYFGMTGQETTLTGYLRVGGHLSVLGLISISVEFYLAFTYLGKDGGRSEIWGQASLSVSVKVACFSTSVTLTVERRFAGASGDPTFDQVVEPDDWQQYCLAFAG